MPTEFPFISSGPFQQIQPVQRIRASRLVRKQTTKNPKIQHLQSKLLYGLNWISGKKFLMWGKKLHHHRYETWSVIKSSPSSHKQCFHTFAVLQVLNSTSAAIPPSTSCCWSKAAHEYNRSVKVLVHMQPVSFRLKRNGVLQQNSLLACPWYISITVLSTSHLDTIFLDYK